MVVVRSQLCGIRICYLMPKVCIFCGRHGPFSREHVIPEWAARLLSVGRLSVEPRRMGVSMRPWATVGTFGHTVNSVCARCNNGWMAELEGLAKPVLARLIRPNGPVELSQDKQAFLTAWLWKLAIVHEHITSATYFNAAERRCLIRMDDPPTRGVHLWIGYYSGRNIAALRGGPSTFSAPDGRHVDAYLLSMNLRRFAAQLSVCEVFGAFSFDRSRSTTSPIMNVVSGQSRTSLCTGHRLRISQQLSSSCGTNDGMPRSDRLTKRPLHGALTSTSCEGRYSLRVMFWSENAYYRTQKVFVLKR